MSLSLVVFVIDINVWVYSLYYVNESQEYHDNIGDLDGPEEKERAQSKISKFISALS